MNASPEKPHRPASAMTLEPRGLLPWEVDEYLDLQWMPQAMRFKLDVVGLKLSLKPWQALPIETRHELLQAAFHDAAQHSAWRNRLVAALSEQGLEAATECPPLSEAPFDPALEAAWRQAGFALSSDLWSKFTPFARALTCKAVQASPRKQGPANLAEIAAFLGLPPLC